MAIELTKEDWRTIASAARSIDGGPLGDAAIPAVRYILVLGLASVYGADNLGYGSGVPDQSHMLALLERLRPAVRARTPTEGRDG